MSTPNPIDLMRRLANTTWRLPCPTAHANMVTVTLYQNSQFSWEIQAANVRTRLTQVVTGPEWRGNWSVRATPSRAVRLGSSTGSFGSSFGGRRAAAPPAAAPGPYLVLNFTDLTKCMANITVMGTHLHLGDWANHVFQVFRDGNYRVLNVTAAALRLQCPDGQVQEWLRGTDPGPAGGTPAHLRTDDEEV